MVQDTYLFLIRRLIVFLGILIQLYIDRPFLTFSPTRYLFYSQLFFNVIILKVDRKKYSATYLDDWFADVHRTIIANGYQSQLIIPSRYKEPAHD